MGHADRELEHASLDVVKELVPSFENTLNTAVIDTNLKSTGEYRQYNRFLGLREVGGLAYDHFVQQDSEQVPVYTLAVAGFPDHLGGQVGHRSAERFSASRGIKHAFFTQTEIR